MSSLQMLKEAVMSFRIIELRKCYTFFNEPVKPKNARKAVLQNRVFLWLEQLSKDKDGIPMPIFGRILKLESDLKKEKINRRRKRVQNVTRRVFPDAGCPKTPFFEVVKVLKTATIVSEGTLDVKIPVRYIRQLRAKVNKTYNYDVQVLFTAAENRKWTSPTFHYKVNDEAVQVVEKSPPIIYIAQHCTLKKNARNIIEVCFPRNYQEFNVTVSVVKRLTPDQLMELRPVAAISRVGELVTKKCQEDRVHACEVYLINPDNSGYITLPCRSSFCNHPEVFDLQHFLNEMQYFIDWYCPVCAKHITYESLELDKYFLPQVKRGIYHCMFIKPKDIKHTSFEDVQVTEDLIKVE